ncbi:hypothetical protein ACTMTI_55310 [Nonomuraea sp. H19]|uniref:hypothetical protein n=1 Tax=Nonomuraea sp. H19 TaxID=3452206 RepID=UPI003F895ABD
MRLFGGDDWAEDHHDVELMDAAGARLAKARLPEGVAGMARLHAMIAEQLGPDIPDDQPTSHASPDMLLTSRTSRPRSVKADAIPHRG